MNVKVSGFSVLFLWLPLRIDGMLQIWQPKINLLQYCRFIQQCLIQLKTLPKSILSIQIKWKLKKEQLVKHSVEKQCYFLEVLWGRGLQNRRPLKHWNHYPSVACSVVHLEKEQVIFNVVQPRRCSKLCTNIFHLQLSVYKKRKKIHC